MKIIKYTPYVWTIITNHNKKFSRLLHRSHEFKCSSDDDIEESCDKSKNEQHFNSPSSTSNILLRLEKEGRVRGRSATTTGHVSSTSAMILQSFYRKHGGSSAVLSNNTNNNTVRLQDLFKTFSAIQPATSIIFSVLYNTPTKFTTCLVIACLHNAITMQNREPGNRSVCSPAHRWRQCQYHCIQIVISLI
jgi:hypothetical protein